MVKGLKIYRNGKHVYTCFSGEAGAAHYVQRMANIHGINPDCYSIQAE